MIKISLGTIRPYTPHTLYSDHDTVEEFNVAIVSEACTIQVCMTVESFMFRLFLAFQNQIVCQFDWLNDGLVPLSIAECVHCMTNIWISSAVLMSACVLYGCVCVVCCGAPLKTADSSNKKAHWRKEAWKGKKLHDSSERCEWKPWQMVQIELSPLSQTHHIFCPLLFSSSLLAFRFRPVCVCVAWLSLSRIYCTRDRRCLRSPFWP